NLILSMREVIHKSYVFSFLISLSISTFSQESFNWYFGERAALSFHTNPPSIILGSSMTTYEGSASISDTAGNLLFYTNGFRVYDRNNSIMPNGNGLMGGLSSTNSCIILLKP